MSIMLFYKTTLFLILLSMELVKTIAICCQTNVNFKFHKKDDAIISQSVEGGHLHPQNYIHTYIDPYIDPYIDTYIDTYIVTYIDTYIDT